MTAQNMQQALNEKTLDPSKPQALAADPAISAWVGASAGTGKTKVLIDRVLRLMLPRVGQDAASATKPERVLCLTFTKTAAAEMSNRIYSELGAWAVLDDATLAGKLQKLNGVAPDDVMMREARRLFARVLDTPGGLNIMTIHSFCQSVLKRFPVEAGLPPHFQLMDERQAVEYLTRCLHDIIAFARSQPQDPLAESFSLLAQYLDAAAMSDLMAKIMAKRATLAAVFAHHGDHEGRAEKTIDAVYKLLDVDRNMRVDDLLAQAATIAPTDEINLRRAAQLMIEGSKRDSERGRKIADYLAAPADRPQLLNHYRGAFFTKKEFFKDFVTKPTREKWPDIHDVLLREAERLRAIDEKLVALGFARLNGALLAIAAEMTGRYTQYKRQTDKLDFDDLIIRTCDLLQRENMVGWVLYKLDEGIDHILVDEAQDTSPAQWRVVRALAEEFFAGFGRSDEKIRTLFVVGDEKQSIFSFQGADPAEFARMQAHFGARVQALQDQWVVPLSHSFRSTQAVLEMVDRVFARETARAGVVADPKTAVHHIPVRAGHAGLVEIWPLIKTRAEAEQTPWTMPVGVEAGDSAGVRLSQKIAGTIRGWLDSGEKLESQGRPIRAGDVLILVQSRGALVEQLMRALKEENVPVAGIDRMTLTEEIAVMDLLALASFALQRDDDLTLATLLKSPLIGMDEETLFDVCHGRRGKLWVALGDKHPAIADYLKPFLIDAGRKTPYAFFAAALNMPCHADPVSGRRAFYGRLGRDIEDALDEFLNACLHYEQSNTPSLQKFVEWFKRGESEIKREQESHQSDQVRIMTVHGSKGLQAPVVFMPDTVKKLHDHPKGRVRLLWPDDNLDDAVTVPLWSPRSDFDAPLYAARRGAATMKQDEEYRRLLYVAMTRAEDRLYVGGYYNARAPRDDSWYELISSAFPADAATYVFGQDAEGADMVARRHSCPQTVAPQLRDQTATASVAADPMPDWVLTPPVPEPSLPKPLTPSKPGADEPAVKSPLAEDTGWRFHRGLVVHGILEILPQLPPEKRWQALEKYLSRPSLNMPAVAQKELAAVIGRLLDDPDFAPIFDAAAQAEVPVVGIAGATQHVISGQIDRLLVRENDVLIVDYKTNRPPPAAVADVAPVYLKQMAAYRAVLGGIYPDKKIRAALLWTDDARLMVLPDDVLDKYAP